jgi:hypothetical protein
MVRIKRLSKNSFHYNLGYRWEVIGKYGTDITPTLSRAIRYWLWHCGIPAKYCFKNEDIC